MLKVSDVAAHKNIIDNRLMSKDKLENMGMVNPKLFGRDFECKY